MVAIIKLKDRDKKLLRELYDLRILSAKQIVRLYHGNSHYGYNRIRGLQDIGDYLGSRPLTLGRKKITQYYFVTEKAIRELEIENPRQMTKKQIKDKYLVERQLSINEVYITLMQQQQNGGVDIWKGEERREAKKSYGFNPNDLIAGVLTNKENGRKYGICLSSKQADMDDLLSRMQKELDRHFAIRENIISPHNPGDLRIINASMKVSELSLTSLPHA